MVDRDRWDDDTEDFNRNFCCCKDEMARVLKRLSSGGCSEVEVFLTSGSDCCSITGTICDVRLNDCILVLCETQQGRNSRPGPPQITRRGKCFISVDKIAAVCEVCPNSFPPGPPGPPRTNESSGGE